MLSEDGDNMTEEETFKQRKKLDEVPLYVPSSNEPSDLFEELKKCILHYHPSTDLSLIEKAYNVAYEAHKDQKRKSGEPYICLLYTSPSPRDLRLSRMPSSA